MISLCLWWLLICLRGLTPLWDCFWIVQMLKIVQLKIWDYYCCFLIGGKLWDSVNYMGYSSHIAPAMWYLASLISLALLHTNGCVTLHDSTFFIYHIEINDLIFMKYYVISWLHANEIVHGTTSNGNTSLFSNWIIHVHVE